MSSGVFDLHKSRSRSRQSSVAAANSASGVPAPYGRACTSCSKAKCRCVYRGSVPGSGACERCHRLAKNCVPSETVRKRTPKRHAVSRTAQLEEKLDDLVSLLRTQRQAKSDARESSERSASETSPKSAHLSGPSESLARPFHSRAAAFPNHADESAPVIPSPPSSHDAAESRAQASGHASSTASAGSPPVPAATLDSSDESEVEHCLDAFRTRFLHFYPFFYAPASMTAKQLQKDRPLTMLAIRCITARSATTQSELSDELRSLIARKTVVENESSLDVLLAILSYTGWGHLHKREKPFMTLFTRLAAAQVVELGLHRSFGDVASRQLWKDTSPKQQMPDPFGRGALTNEDRRAALGCYCLCSLASSTMKRFDFLHLTPYMEEMLRHLEMEPEWEGDKVLVAHVKIQQLIEQMYNARADASESRISRLAVGEAVSGAIESPKPLPPYYISLLRARLKDLTGSLPQGVRTHDAVEPMLYALELMIAECAISKPIKSTVTGQAEDKAESSLAADHTQLDLWHSCANSIERYLNRVFAMPAINFHGLSFTMCSQLTHALIGLFRLTMIEHPHWDRAALRRRLDVLEMVDRTTSKVVELREIAGLDVGPDGTKFPGEGEVPSVFSKSWNLMKRMRAGWEVELKKLGGGGEGVDGEDPTQTLGSSGGEAGAGGDPMVGGSDGQLSHLMMDAALDMQQQPQSYAQYNALSEAMLPHVTGGFIGQVWPPDVFYSWDYQNAGLNWANI